MGYESSMVTAGIEAQVPAITRTRAPVLLLIALLALCAGSMLYGGWLSDDFLIGLRQTLNLVHGRGFSFFSESRVQTMTSPLWGLVLAPVVGLLDVFYAPILFSIVLSLGAIGILMRQFWKDANARLPFLIALAFLTWSRAFIDFSSSGLENPLAYVLAAWFFALWLSFPERRTMALFLQIFATAALLCITRYDYAVLVAPSLVWALWLSRKERRVWLGPAVFAGVVLPWVAFALVYYGTIFPNAFYAKLTTGIGSDELISSGIKYLLAHVSYDPATVLLFLLALGFTLASVERARWLHLLVGICGYVAYSVMAGGDFMAGRFLSVPVLFSAALVCRSLVVMQEPRRLRAAQWGLCICLLATARELPILNNYFSHESMQAAGKQIEIAGRVNDEKNAYIGQRGLFSGGEGFASWLIGKAALWRSPTRQATRRTVQIDCGGLGWLGFEYGPDADVYDTCALADPFMSKLPLYEVGATRRLLHWGPGHYTRNLPEGYQASLASGRNELSDPVLAEVYDSMRLITAGPFFDAARWRAIYELATLQLVKKAQGASTYDGVAHAKPQRTYNVPYGEYSRLFRGVCSPAESALDLEGTDALSIVFREPTRAQMMRVSGTVNQALDVRFLLGSDDVGQMVITPKPTCDFGIGIVDSGLPPTTADRGFDRIVISAPAGQKAQVGGLFLHGYDAAEPPRRKGRRVFDVGACSMLHGRGEVTDRCSVHVAAGNTDPGHLVFGPYVTLRRGGYFFELDYRIGATRGARTGQWDVVAHFDSGVEVVLARGDLAGTDGERSTLTGTFWITADGSDPKVEVRMWPEPSLEAEAFGLRLYEAESIVEADGFVLAVEN
jgi:arabinofuranosyltransferase